MAWKDMFNNAMGAFSFKDLLNAAATGDHDFIKGYLQQWPDRINKQDFAMGRNALMHATIKGATDTMKLLLDKGASIRETDLSGYNVLHMAVVRGSLDKTALLLGRADIASILNQKNPKSGMTALMYAALHPDDSAIVKRLLEKGADFKLTDYTGKTALSIAKEKGNAKTIALLEQWAKGQNLTERIKPKRYKF